MSRQTGQFRFTKTDGEVVRAFVPYPLPPSDPPLRMDGKLTNLHTEALAEIARLAAVGVVVPDPNLFLYAFVRKEAVILFTNRRNSGHASRHCRI